MTTDNETSAMDGTEQSLNDNQAAKTYTQKEVDDMMAKTKTAVMKKISSKYEDLGDPDELRDIVAQHRKNKEDYQLKRGEFEKVLQEKLSVKDAEIQKRDRIIESYRVETPILDAAARHRSVNPDQVKALVRGLVRLNQDGEVEVTDNRGQVRYNDAGKPLSVEDLVQEFLQSNPHFVQPTPSTSATKSSVGYKADNLDITKLDMSNPEHRKLYAESRKGR